MRGNTSYTERNGLGYTTTHRPTRSVYIPETWDELLADPLAPLAPPTQKEPDMARKNDRMTWDQLMGGAPAAPPVITTPPAASTWGATFDAPDPTPPASPTNTSHPERMDAQRQIDAAKQRAEDAEADLAEALARRETEAERADAAEADLAEAQAEHAKQLAAAEARNEKLTTELEEAQAEVEDAREAQSELAAARERIADLENAAAVEANRLSAAWKEIKELRASLAAGRDKAPALAPIALRDVDAARTIRALQGDLDAAYERITGLKAANAELRAWADRATTAAPSPPAERDTTPPAPRQRRKPAPEVAPSAAQVTPAPRQPVSTRQRFDLRSGKWIPV